MDRKLLMDYSRHLDEFIQAVIYDHSVATGLKACESNQQIVDYACSLGYSFSQVEWSEYVAADWRLLTAAQSDLIRAADVTHWSWAFRQVSSWRAMLMEGA